VRLHVRARAQVARAFKLIRVITQWRPLLETTRALSSGVGTLVRDRLAIA
jgi:hypothetical protein